MSLLRTRVRATNAMQSSSYSSQPPSSRRCLSDAKLLVLLPAPELEALLERQVPRLTMYPSSEGGQCCESNVTQ